jgi:hypothetical protein
MPGTAAFMAWKSRQVNGDDRIPLLVGEVFYGRGKLDARVVHENVKTAERMFRLPHHIADLRRLGHVGGGV